MSKTSKKKKPQPVAQQSKGELMQRMAHRHLDLLQNVEFLLANCAKTDPSIDDAVIAQALRAIIKAEVPEDERAIDVVDALLEWEESRPEIADRLWHDAYKVVLESVYRHSTLHPGNRNYLNFIEGYVP